MVSRIFFLNLKNGNKLVFFYTSLFQNLKFIYPTLPTWINCRVSGRPQATDQSGQNQFQASFLPNLTNLLYSQRSSQTGLKLIYKIKKKELKDQLQFDKTFMFTVVCLIVEDF